MSEEKTPVPDEPFDGFVFGSTLKGGTYDARLISLGRYHFEWEGAEVEKVRWTFQVATAEGVEEVTGSTSTAFTKKPASTAFLWATSLLGREPHPGERVSDQILNQPCIVNVELKDNGWPKVTAVLPAKR